MNRFVTLGMLAMIWLIPLAVNAMGPDRGEHRVSPLRFDSGKARAVGLAAVSDAEENPTDPQGEEKVYVTEWMQMFGDMIIDNTGIAHRVRFGDDGKVYFHDFFATRSDVWIEGTINGDGLITIPTHQTVGRQEVMEDYFVDLTIELSTFEFSDESMSSKVDMEAESFTLQLMADGSIVSTDLDLPWEERHYPVAFYRDRVYALCGSINMVPCRESVVTPPNYDLLPDKFSYSFRKDVFCNATLVDGYIQGKEAYISGLCPELPEVWLKGTLSDDGTKLTIKSGQYMGYDQYHHHFYAAHPNPDASESTPGTPRWVKDDEMVLTLDQNGGGYEFDPSTYVAVAINGDVTWAQQALKLVPYADVRYTSPMPPVITTGSELLWLEADFLPFVQPNVDLNGNYLDVDHLSWRMYYDDELFTFTPAEYMNLSAPTDEIPYCFSDNWDFIVYDDVMEECVAIYRSSSEYKGIGIESVYRVGDECYVSARSYFGEAPMSSIDKVETSGEAVSTLYYDLLGRVVSHPASGIYLRIDKMADGSTMTSKVRIR